MGHAMEEALKAIQENVLAKMKHLGLSTTTCKVTDIRCGIASAVRDVNGAVYYTKYQEESPGIDEYLGWINQNFAEEVACLQGSISDFYKDPEFIKSAKEEIETGNVDGPITLEGYICEMALAFFICGNMDYNWCTTCEDCM